MTKIKGITKSCTKCIESLLGLDAVLVKETYDAPALSLLTVDLNDEVMMTVHTNGVIILDRNGNVFPLENDDYVEISII